MTLDRFKEIVMITDFTFIYGGDEYFIDPFGHGEFKVIKVTEEGAGREEEAQVFHSYDEVLKLPMGDGKPLKDIIPEIEWD